MTGCASPRMEQLLAMSRSHHIGWLQCKVAFLQGQEEVRERFGDLSPFPVAQMRQHIRHGGSGFRPMRIAEKGLKIMWIDPRSNRRQPGRLLRLARKWRLARVTGGAIQFLEQDQAFEVRSELTGNNPGNDDLGEGCRNGACEQQSCRNYPAERSHDGRMLIGAEGMPILFLNRDLPTRIPRRNAPSHGARAGWGAPAQIGTTQAHRQPLFPAGWREIRPPRKEQALPPGEWWRSTPARAEAGSRCPAQPGSTGLPEGGGSRF